MSESSRNQPSDKWLEAHRDPAAMLYTFSSGICLADLHGDGDYRLVVADLGTGTYNMKLKVYRGVHLASEHTVVDLPTGLAAFHMDTCDPRAAALAVASGGNIFVYKNMRPFYKFTLPGLDIHPTELDIWNKVSEEELSINELQDALENLRAEVKESVLTARSQRFLKLGAEEMEPFVQFHKQFPLKRQTVITCLTTMKKSMTDETALSCLVLGTESRQIYVLEPNAFTILSVMALAGVPVFLDVTGLFDVEYSMVVACRDAGIYTLKRGFKAGKLCVQLSSQPSGLARLNTNIIVGTMDQHLLCYSIKGKCLWTIRLPSPVTAMCSVALEHLSTRLVAVALANGAVSLYHDRYLVDVILPPFSPTCPEKESPSAVVGLRFGRFGREENTLVVVSKDGGLLIKILKRTAQFDSGDLGSQLPPSLQNLKLNVPKKTKLFVDQTMRERDNALDMHRIFQGDMFRLKLHVYREFYRTLRMAQNPVSDILPLRISAQVLGLGPTFKINVTLQNTSSEMIIVGLFVLFDYDAAYYELENHRVDLPMILPDTCFNFAVKTECLNSQIVENIIKVYVMKENAPLVTAVITMPPSEGEKPGGGGDGTLIARDFEEAYSSPEIKERAEELTAILADIYDWDGKEGENTNKKDVGETKM